MKFRKKPVVIEAVQWNGNVEIFKPWMKELGALPIVLMPLPQITIKTLEGDHLAQIGDWIIKGVKGELYPCKPDIFALTYEFVSSEETQMADAASEFDQHKGYKP